MCYNLFSFSICSTTNVKFNSTYCRLRVRDEEYLHLKKENEKYRDEVMGLRMQIRREEENYNKLADLNKQLAEDRDQFKDR